MRSLLVALATITIVGLGFVFSGPVLTGSLFWLLPPRVQRVRHPPVASYWKATHKGGVDISTGLYTRNDDDLIVDDAMPLSVQRAYLSSDHVSREFGVGGTHAGEIYLIGDGRTFQWVELILADGGRIHFDRLSSGTSIANAVFWHISTPSRFFGARVAWVGFEWALRMADGTLGIFKACSPKGHDKCGILQVRDWDGHRIQYVRDQSGLLLRIQGATHEIAFTYDDRRRVTRAYEPGRDGVTYEYDDRGRLARVVSSSAVRRYTYDDRDELIGIDEPGRSIRNTFDANGRVIGQVTRLTSSPDPVSFTFSYVVEKGAVLQTDMSEDGVRTRYTYNASHYVMSETVNADGANPAVIAYHRDAVTNVAQVATVQCISRQGPLVRTINTTAGAEVDEAESFVQQNCYFPSNSASPAFAHSTATVM